MHEDLPDGFRGRRTSKAMQRQLGERFRARAENRTNRKRRMAAVPLMLGLVLIVAGAAEAQVGSVALQNCVAAERLLFSTEVGFLDQGPVPPDGNPLISDGDLLGFAPPGGCAVCARNADLLSTFGVAVDLGLDAIDVIPTGQGLISVFSTELDGPAQGPPIGAGDLLTSDGAIIPNEVLLQLFGVSHDVGLDAVHAVGDPDDLREFFESAARIAYEEWLTDPPILLDLLNGLNVDLWISTEGDAPVPAMPAWLDGDLLSVSGGSVVISNGSILPPDVPAGLPVRGVDYGLDAATSDRTLILDALQVSTEIGHTSPPIFDASDHLGRLLGWKIAGEKLTGCFEPRSGPLGLDALATTVPEPETGTAISVAVLWLALFQSRSPSPLSDRRQPQGLPDRA